VASWLLRICSVSVLTIQHYVTNPDTGWRWPIGCLKLQVIFRKRATHYRALEVIFRKSDIYLLALLWKIICNLGDPMSLRHPVWHFPLKLLHPRNPPNPKTQIARYLAIKNSYWDFGLIWICTKEFEFLDLVSQVSCVWQFFQLGPKSDFEFVRRDTQQGVYGSSHWNDYTLKIHRIEKLRLLGISWYKFKLRFWLNSNSNLYRGIWVSGFGGFWSCSDFSGNCHCNTFSEVVV